MKDSGRATLETIGWLWWGNIQDMGELGLLGGPLFKYFLEYFVSKYLEYEGELGLLVLFLNICLNIQDMRELVLFLLQGALPLKWPLTSSVALSLLENVIKLFSPKIFAMNFVLDQRLASCINTFSKL